MTRIGQFGSGLDVESIVSGLVLAETEPAAARIDRRESRLNAELSALGQLKSSLSGIQDSLTKLSSFDAFGRFTASSSDAAISATAGSGSVAADYELSVSKLASSQTLATTAFADDSAVIGTGTLTIELGQAVYANGVDGDYSGFTADPARTATINITDGTLTGIRNAINEANVGVQASIVRDDSGSRLLLTSSDTGVSNSISISTSGDADGDNLDAGGLSALNYFVDGGGVFTGNIQEIQTASNAEFSLNGLALTSESNTVSDLVDGLSITLESETTAPVTVSVATDETAILEDVQAFVDAYNTFAGRLASSTASSPTAGAGGALLGDSGARQIAATIRRGLSEPFSGLSGPFTTLTSIGIQSDRDGRLSLDETKFKAALAESPDGVRQLFQGDGAVDGLATRLDTSLETYTNGATGILSSRTSIIEGQIRDLDDDREVLNRRLLSLEERFRAQFTTLDLLVGRLQGTSDFISSQLSVLQGPQQR